VENTSGLSLLIPASFSIQLVPRGPDVERGLLVEDVVSNTSNNEVSSTSDIRPHIPTGSLLFFKKIELPHHDYNYNHKQ
jgi:hypothetical protein